MRLKHLWLHHLICSPKLPICSYVATHGSHLYHHSSVHINSVQTSTLCSLLSRLLFPRAPSRGSPRAQKQTTAVIMPVSLRQDFSILLFPIIHPLKTVCVHLNTFIQHAFFFIFWAMLLTAKSGLCFNSSAMVMSSLSRHHKFELSNI